MPYVVTSDLTSIPRCSIYLTIEKILKSKYQTLAVVFIIKQTFDNVFEYTCTMPYTVYTLHLQYIQPMNVSDIIEDILNLFLNFNEHNILSLWSDTVSFCKKSQVAWSHSKNIHKVVNLPVFATCTCRYIYLFSIESKYGQATSS